MLKGHERVDIVLTPVLVSCIHTYVHARRIKNRPSNKSHELRSPDSLAVYVRMMPSPFNGDAPDGSKFLKDQSMPCHQQACHHLYCKLSGVRSGYETKINTDGDDHPCVCIHTTTIVYIHTGTAAFFPMKHIEEGTTRPWSEFFLAYTSCDSVARPESTQS